MADGPLRTEFAMQALSISELFQIHLGDFVFPGLSQRAPKLTVPEGQSTGGGAQAKQSLTLTPTDPSHGTIVGGTVDGAAMTVELRGYPYLNATHRMRFGRPIDIPQDAYLEFLEKARKVFENSDYRVNVVNQIPTKVREHLEKQAAPKASSGTIWIILAVGVIVAAVVIGFMMRS